MRVLHLVKTADGAEWAAEQVAELVTMGVEVHVALPSLEGRMLPAWRRSGAEIHCLDADFPARAPWHVGETLAACRRLVKRIGPDIIHSHFVGTTQTVRLALGKANRTPRVFQVPGPLHLEHWAPRRFEIACAGENDYWIASSEYIRSLYLRAGVPRERVWRSYYGTRLSECESAGSEDPRRTLGLATNAFVIGNVNYMYRPKRLLGQTRGLKGHETVIDAIARVSRRAPEVVGVLVGGGWGRDAKYEQALRELAERAAPGRIVMPGFMPRVVVAKLWHAFDLVVHAPVSENCGGIHEAMIAGAPVLVTKVGGLPELVVDGVTGRCIEDTGSRALADAIVEAMGDEPGRKRMASAGQERARNLFDVRRTAKDVREVYDAIIQKRSDGGH